MSEKIKKRAFALFLGFVITFSAFLFAVGGVDASVGDSVSIFEDESLSLPAYAECDYKVKTQGFTFDNQATVELFGIGIKNISVDVYKDVKLYPGGMAFGVKMSTKGVMIVGINSIKSDKEITPAQDAGLKIGDMILKINDIEVKNAEELSNIVSKSGGASLTVLYSRDGIENTTEITPAKDSSDGIYKTGLWVRDNTAGIGTVTYIDPQTGNFGGLGHGICDADTGNILPLREGVVNNVIINGVNKGKGGTPGELRGFFDGETTGKIYKNTNSGVFGKFDSFDAGEMQSIPIALKRDIKEGKAEIICTTEENVPTRYEIEISKIISQNTETKNFVIKVTDERLLQKTGGIVQGMSGSPIIQDGHLVGAVTHVLVNDPRRGYGIFIENMLKEANKN